MPRKKPAAVIFFTNIALQVTVVTNFVCGPTFQRLFNLSDTQLGISLGSASVGVLVVSLAVGHITERYGAHLILAGGLCGIIGGVGLLMFADGFRMLLPALALFGVSVAFVRNGGDTFLADLFPSSIRSASALASGLWFSGGAVSAPIMGWWLETAKINEWSFLSFRVPYFFDIALIGLCLFFVLKILPGTQRRIMANSSNGDAVFESEVCNRVKFGRLFLLLLLSLCHGLMVISLLAWVNPTMQSKFDVGDLGGAVVVAMLSLGIGLGRLTFARVKTGLEDRSILAVSGLSGGVLLGVGLVSPNYITMLVCMTAGTFVVSTTLPCLVSLVMVCFAGNKSRVYGYMGAIVALAGLAGPSFIGILADEGVELWVALLISPLAAFILGLTSFLWKLTDSRIWRV